MPYQDASLACDHAEKGKFFERTTFDNENTGGSSLVTSNSLQQLYNRTFCFLPSESMHMKSFENSRDVWGDDTLFTTESSPPLNFRSCRARLPVFLASQMKDGFQTLSKAPGFLVHANYQQRPGLLAFHTSNLLSYLQCWKTLEITETLTLSQEFFAARARVYLGNPYDCWPISTASWSLLSIWPRDGSVISSA